MLIFHKTLRRDLHKHQRYSIYLFRYDGSNGSNIARSQHRTRYGVGIDFADGLVGTSETPRTLLRSIAEVLERPRKWRVTTNVQSCGVVVCDEDRKTPVKFEWKWGEEDLPIGDQYTYLGGGM